MEGRRVYDDDAVFDVVFIPGGIFCTILFEANTTLLLRRIDFDILYNLTCRLLSTIGHNQPNKCIIMD